MKCYLRPTNKRRFFKYGSVVHYSTYIIYLLVSIHKKNVIIFHFLRETYCCPIAVAIGTIFTGGSTERLGVVAATFHGECEKAFIQV